MRGVADRGRQERATENSPAASQLLSLASFWAGQGMSALDKACLRSFVAGGHSVTLYSYEKVEDLPNGVTPRDARIRVDHTDDALSAGERGPTLLEDFHAREKVTHFDHERIPERVVHARGAGAYGYFEPYDDSLADYTVAKFLTTPGKQTPVFVRFSTVAGSRG